MTATAAAPVLTFEPIRHAYRLDGRPIPSVTQVLHAVGLISDEWYNEGARTRGTYVHKMIMYDEREGLDERTVDPRLAGYLKAYRKFVRDVQPGPCQLLETPLADPTLWFAGTPDQIRPIGGRLVLLDHKSGGPERWHRLQTAAYDRLAHVHDPSLPPLERYALYLRSSGEYRLEQHKDRRDFKVFQAALAVAQWKEAA